jgi:hypothetical protein
MNTDTRKFFMVYNPSQGAPSHKHFSFSDAKAEARRLSAKQPGDTFYVLRGKDSVTTLKPDVNALFESVRAARAGLVSAEVALTAALVMETEACASVRGGYIALREAEQALLAATRV